MAVSAPPLTEQGSIREAQIGPGLSWNAFIDDQEYVQELIWPLSVNTYWKMMKTAQIKGLLSAGRLPLERRRWVINKNGASAESVQKLSEDLGLPVKGEDPEDTTTQRRRDRFSFKRHFTDAYRALGYGHYFFEQVGELDEDGMWRLKKLAARAPRTLAVINVAPDGGLQSIKQNIGMSPPEIPVNRLVGYVWDGEPGDWIGESMLRAIFQNYISKDILLRVDIIKHQRAGGGVPTATAPAGASRQQVEALDAMARSFKVSEDGGGALPHGAVMELMGIKGSVPDTIGSIRYHDEQMAGAFLAMFKQLGQTQTGSRALGESFVDFFSLGLDAIAEWFLETFNAHVIEDWYDWNYGEDSQPAIVECLPPEDPDIDIADLKAMIDSGAIKVDDEIENEIRARFKFPMRSEPRPAAPVIPPPPGTGEDDPSDPEPGTGSTGPEARRRSHRAAADGVSSPSFPLPPRELRRQPYEHEIRAAVDFAAIDANLSGGIDQLINEIKIMQQAQIAELHDLIADANGDLAKLTSILAEPVAATAIGDAMTRMAEMGIAQAVDEAVRQGKVEPARPDVSDVDSLIASRAEATDRLLANAISESARRQAVMRTGEGLGAAAVADEVAQSLAQLSDRFIKDQVGGAMTQAMNTGRRLAISENDPAEIYSSELLDSNTCTNCVGKDGTLYASMEEAEKDYPTGGYKECAGMTRCRGTLVAVYPEARSEGAGLTIDS